MLYRIEYEIERRPRLGILFLIWALFSFVESYMYFVIQPDPATVRLGSIEYLMVFVLNQFNHTVILAALTYWLARGFASVKSSMLICLVLSSAIILYFDWNQMIKFPGAIAGVLLFIYSVYQKPRF